MNRHWALKLGEICEIVSGATPKTGVKEYWNGDIAWATPADLSDLEGHYIDDTPRKITVAGLASCAARVLPANSVLLSSRAPIGHVAINTVPMATNQGFKSLIPKSGLVDAKYLFHWLRFNKSKIQALGNGATFKEVSKAIVSEISIYLPSLDEQRRIAAILDKADALRQKRKRAIALLDSLTQSIFLEMFGGERHWPEAPLADVVTPGTIVTYGIVQAGGEYENGIPYIRTGDIQDGKIVVSGLRRTDPTIAAKFERSRVRTDEIVMSIRATVGTVALVPHEIDGANLTQGTARISPGPNTNELYLLHYLRSAGVQAWIKRQVKGATFLEITLGRLRELMVTLPPLELQREFASRISTITKTSILSGDNQNYLESLFASLQSRAFSGQL